MLDAEMNPKIAPIDYRRLSRSLEASPQTPASHCEKAGLCRRQQKLCRLQLCKVWLFMSSVARALYDIAHV